MASKLKILLVEDNPSDVRYIKELFSKDKNIKLVIVELLSKAIKLLNKDDYSLILLDLNLPDSRGIDTFKKFTTKTGNVPIMILTVVDNKETAIEAIRMGAQDYRIKGTFDYKSLKTSIDQSIERNNLKNSLKISEIKYKDLFENSIEMIHIINNKGKMIDVNETELKKLGFTKNELIGTKSINLVHPNYRKATKKEIKKVLQGKYVKDYETVFVTKKGEEINVQINATPRIKNGKVIEAKASIRDITKQKEMDKLKIETKTQKKLEALRSNLLMMITHELKQPLTPIMGYAQLIRDEMKTNEQKEYLQKIINNSEMMKEMINRILTLFKLEAGTLELNYKRNNLRKLILNILNYKMPSFELKKLKILTNLKDVSVNYDEERIKDVLVNLFDNAIKFSKEKGKIKISLKQDKKCAIISVKDYGVGIKKNDIPKLFEKFYQTKEGKRAGGTGIGLAMIKLIIEKHKGTIIVKSKYKKGTEFIIKMPKVKK